MSELSPHLQHLLEVVVGQPWPEGDQKQLWAMSDAYDAFYDAIGELETALVRSAHDLAQYDMRPAAAHCAARRSGGR